jgi:hypothetical protein
MTAYMDAHQQEFIAKNIPDTDLVGTYILQLIWLCTGSMHNNRYVECGYLWSQAKQQIFKLAPTHATLIKTTSTIPISKQRTAFSITERINKEENTSRIVPCL